MLFQIKALHLHQSNKKKGIYMLGINAPKILVKGEFARLVREKAIRSMKAAAEGKQVSKVNSHWTYKFVE